MDPTANMQEQLALSKSILKRVEGSEPATATEVWRDAARLAELTLSLHNWIVGGGHEPRQWTAKKQAFPTDLLAISEMVAESFARGHLTYSQRVSGGEEQRRMFLAAVEAARLMRRPLNPLPVRPGAGDV